jgi:hypothetical protein
MPFEFIQIPANGQGNAKEELNKLLRGGRIASVRKEFVAKVAGASRSRPLSGRLALTPNAGGETPPATNWRETRPLLSRPPLSRIAPFLRFLTLAISPSIQP